ncbi:RND family efflux transporter MFP subunit [Pseudoduganella flava]|uniref:Efflux RND transporter periplasmic adaptor subunit n=1 Tax=Pseudoduganella flava TaxID=871742 RepID=A0A562PVM5_9BURK|nr:efflux RND transporter periplasmic adaptor subunit [Pseudoduganella flava]QGZ39598.1 efflux RND transporter periplasmic adaptor subunit [Pseudoduganella flava]TWI48495.1 RND family efflux transporter MFP subunit [Pseudoduganella flava]
MTLPAALTPARRVLLAGALLALLAAGGWTVLHAHTGAAPAPATPAAKPAPIYELAGTDVATVGSGALAVQLQLSGSLVPVAQATVKSKVSGIVHESALREGTQVQAGQVLARVDQADLRARVTQQQAALEEAQARLAMADKNERNGRALLAQNYISQTAYDANANAVDLARAAVKAAGAQLELARIALEDSVIRAPIAGIVSRRHVQPGEKLAPDMPVCTIVSLDELTLEAQVPTSDIPRIRVGQQVRFHVDGYAGRTFAGKVARINPTTQEGSRAMLVYVTVANGDGALRGGMFAKGSITTENTAELPLVPVAAVRKDGGRDVVYKVAGDRVVAQPVTLGLTSEDDGVAAVTAGLAAGENVLVTKLDGVKPGARVKLPAAVRTAAAAGNTVGG